MQALLDLEPIAYLRFIYVVTASIVAIVAYSLFAYALAYNIRSVVARRFAYVALCVLVVFAMDIAVIRVEGQGAAEPWLRIQWLGIAFLPATYYWFATAVVQATHLETRYRTATGMILLLCSVLTALGVLVSEWVVTVPATPAAFPYLQAGPFFWVFAALLALALGHSIRDVWLARARCLTQASRMRINYLLWGLAAPAVGSFPYLAVVGPVVASQAQVSIFLLSIIGNAAMAVLLMAMMLSVAYYGVRMPDRVVRYRLIRFLTRGPITAILAVIALQTLPTVEQILGLPRDLVMFSVVTGVIVAGPLILSLSRPLVDFLIYRGDAREVTWLRELERRLLTPSDIRQFMENHLIALCEFIQVGRGFVAAVSGSHLVVEATVGARMDPDGIMSDTAWKNLLRSALQQKDRLDQPLSGHWEGMCIWPLFGQSGTEQEPIFLGILGLEVPCTDLRSSPQQEAILGAMRLKMAEALLDRQLQVNVLNGLRHIIPDIEKIQDLRGRVPYPAPAAEPGIWLSPRGLAEPDPELTAWVRDALRDFWGGPRLTRSPLIRMKVVDNYLEKTNGNPNHALRLVLGDAIERMRPEAGTERGERDVLLYRILEMRFIQGRKVREIARKLAMSESDLYRKQRIAIEQVVVIIQEMERAEYDMAGRGTPEQAVE